MKLNIENFIKNNTFFLNYHSKVEFVKNNSDNSFGEEFKLFSFNRKGYVISFVYNETENIITSEQVEITNKNEIDDKFLKRIIFSANFKRDFKRQIDAFYCDELGEEVAFLHNGINLHFNNGILSKITSKDSKTRDFVIKFMNKIG